MTTEVSNVTGHLSNTLISIRCRLPGARASSELRVADVARDLGGDVREKVRASDEDRYFFFVKAGPKSGFTWQFSTLPTHIESS